jgi:hypothetical protein
MKNRVGVMLTQEEVIRSGDHLDFKRRREGTEGGAWISYCAIKTGVMHSNMEHRGNADHKGEIMTSGL